jgi:23S rRNA (adenine-N6)-dimethyltransferase
MSVSPSLRHSQNVLTSRRLVDRLLDRSSIGADDVVLDIGAGPGLITERLAFRRARVVAIERDAQLAAHLRQRFRRSSNVEVREADFFAFRLPQQTYKVFANIPFSHTTRIITRLAGPNGPEDAYLVVQQEAAGRFTGYPTGTLWAALLKPWFEPSVVHRFRRSDFQPVPQVDVVMLRLRKRGPPVVDQPRAALYRDFVTCCFTAWRPRLRDTLEMLFGRRRAREIADSSGIRVCDTPSTVRFEQWLALFEAFRTAGSNRAIRRVSNAATRLRHRQRTLKKIYQTRGAGSMLSRAGRL